MATRASRTRRSRAVTFVLFALAFLLLRRAWRAPPDATPVRTQPLEAPRISLDIGDDGRLSVREGEPHPIPALMARARLQWDDLRARQSQTFAQAVAEYERRYGRKPPKGFDQWCAEPLTALLTSQVRIRTPPRCAAGR